MTLPVFLARVNDVKVGDHFDLDGAEGRHAKTVRRIGVSEQLDVVDGLGTRVRAQVIAVDDSGLQLEALTITTEDLPNPQVTVVQALAKGGRDEMAVEICTELGADRIIPWQAERSIVQWSGAKIAKGQQKWENQVLAAAKQARRAHFPVVDQVVESAQLARQISQCVADGGLALICHEEATLPVTLALHERQPTGQIMLVVGPEGGINQRETDAFIAAGAVMVSLGPTVLRSSTAGAVGVMAVNLGLDRWA